MPHVDGWYCILLPRMDGLSCYVHLILEMSILRLCISCQSTVSDALCAEAVPGWTNVVCSRNPVKSGYAGMLWLCEIAGMLWFCEIT